MMWRRRLGIFQTLQQTWGITHTYAAPHPLKAHLFPPESPTTIVGYYPRKIAKYNLRPNPKPNANPDFRRLDAMTATH